MLLLHGASANHGTFTVGKPGLASWLYGSGSFDPWLLDWRGSSLVVAATENKPSLRDQPDIYNFNRAAREDLPAAINKMRLLGGQRPEISFLATVWAVPSSLKPWPWRTSMSRTWMRVVLIALGLFYEARIDSRLKSEERILERLSQVVRSEPVLSIDPSIDEGGKLQHDWPEELKNLYDAWPGALRSHPEDPDRVNAMCNRLSFMYGMPYHHKNLV